MRIYYFGELIEENGVKVNNVEQEKTEILEQTQMELKAPAPARKSSMESIGDILKELDLTIDSFKSRHSLQF